MINFNDVVKSYNGSIGCMCGCRGKYFIPSHVSIEEANKKIGYEGYDRHNDRAVKIAVNKLNKMIDWDNPEEVDKHVNSEFAWFETETRNTTVWFE